MFNSEICIKDFLNDYDIKLWILRNKEYLMIVVGGIVNLISLFLPFWTMQIFLLSIPMKLFQTAFMMPYVVIIGLLVIFLIFSFGKTYPQLFLLIGMSLLILTIVASQIKSGTPSGKLIKLSIGFYLELCASLIVMIGGYLAYQKNRKYLMKSNKDNA